MSKRVVWLCRGEGGGEWSPWRLLGLGYKKCNKHH